MSRQEYLNMRLTQRYDLGAFYRYYLQNKEQNTPNLPFEHFAQAFQFYLKVNLKDIINKLDKEFGIYILMDQKGNGVKIW